MVVLQRVCGQSNTSPAQVLAGAGVCFCLGVATGKRGAWEEHTEVHLEMCLITGAETHKSSKTNRDY